MIVKGTKQLGNFKKGINLYIPKRKTSAAPSGIPTATTTIVNISIVSSGFNDNFYQTNPDVWYDVEANAELSFYNSQWAVRYQGAFFTFNTLPNQTVDYIPLIGWSPADTTVTVVA